jgi:hypothetical protein
VAFDTFDKRSAAVGVSLPFRAQLPLPAGSFDQADRQQLGYYSRAVLFGAEELEATTPGGTFRRRDADAARVFRRRDGGARVFRRRDL